VAGGKRGREGGAEAKNEGRKKRKIRGRRE
jgi:hypothetical protein